MADSPRLPPPLSSKSFTHVVENDRFPLSPRVQTLKGILGKLRPEPVRETLPPPNAYAPRRATAARRREDSANREQIE
jgi:hypothetical protein